MYSPQLVTLTNFCPLLIITAPGFKGTRLEAATFEDMKKLKARQSNSNQKSKIKKSLTNWKRFTWLVFVCH
jgi:hypothetical protein